MEKRTDGVRMVVLLGKPEWKDPLRHHGIMTIFADTVPEAIQALNDIQSGKVDRKDIPKTGLDIRKKINGN